MTLGTAKVSLLREKLLVLNSVSVSLKPGEITVICGPNGAGKSTLLMVLAGLLVPTQGKTIIANEDLKRMEPQARAKQIGYLAQGGGVAWDVAVENLIRLGRLPHGDLGEHEVERVIQLLDLEHLRYRPISKISGGERARVLLARVLVGEPKWVLADEPMAALDLSHQKSLLTSFRMAADAGTGIVLILHDLTLAMNYADRVIILKDGNVVADATPESALRPENIADVWGSDVRWVGRKGKRALVV